MNQDLDTTETVGVVAALPLVQELNRVLGSSCQCWAWRDNAWECANPPIIENELDRELTGSLVPRCWDDQQVLLEFLPHDRVVGAVPIKMLEPRGKFVLLWKCESTDPGLLRFALQQLQRTLTHEGELEKLREENAVFLQQVSEDFEELTFLRSMAENLTMEAGTQDLLRLTDCTLSLLGQLISVEYLAFFECTKDSLAIRSEWTDPNKDETEFALWQVEAIGASLAASAGDRPLVRNHVKPDELGFGVKAIREMVMVPVKTPQHTLGWLLAINRCHNQANLCAEIGWNLSQLELGTRETSLLSTAAAILGAHSSNLSLLEERENLLVNVVRALVSAIDSRDPYTCGHSERVALYARRLAAEVGLDEEGCERMYLTGLLHDLGKIGISDSVLKKDGPLTAEEFAEIKKHPELGWSILQGLEQFQYVLPGVLHHHERYDGKGYPDKLVGEQAPFEGRLLAVVDSFDAMTSDRPYRSGMPTEKAIQILSEGAGTQWDSKLIDAFLAVLPDIEEIRCTYRRPPLPKRTPSASLLAQEAAKQVATSI